MTPFPFPERRDIKVPLRVAGDPARPVVDDDQAEDEQLLAELAEGLAHLAKGTVRYARDCQASGLPLNVGRMEAFDIVDRIEVGSVRASRIFRLMADPLINAVFQGFEQGD